MDSKSAEEGPDNLVGNSKLKSPNSGSDSNTMDSGFQDGGPPTMNTDRNRNDAFPPNVDGSQVCSESNNIPQDGPNPSMNSDAFGRMSENGNPGQMQGYGSFPNNRPNMAMNDQHGGPTNNTGSHEFAGSNGQFGQYGPQNMRGVYPQSSRAPGMGMRPPGGPGGVPMMGGNYPHGGQRLPMSGATIQQQGGPTPTLNQLLQNSGSSHRMQGNYGEQSMGYGHRPPSDMPPGMSSNYMQHGNWNQQGPRQPSVNPYQQTGVNPNYRGQGAQMMPNMRPGGGAVGPGYNQQGGAPFGGHQYPPTSQRFPMGQSPGPGRHTPGSIPGQPPFNQQQMQGQYPPSSQSGFSRGQPGQQGFIGNQSASSPGYMTSPQSSPSMHQPQTPGQGSHGTSSQGPSQMPVPTRPQSNQSISSQENAVVGGNDELGEGTGNSAVNSRTTPTSSVNPTHPSVSGLRPTPSPGGSQGSRSNTPASVTGNQTGSPMPPPRPPSNQVEGQNRIQSPMAAQGYHPQQVMPPPVGPNQMGNYGNKIGPGMMGNQQMGPYPPQQNSQFPNQGDTSTTLTQSIKCPITTEAQATGTSSSEPLTMKSEPHPSIPPSMPPHPMMRPPMPPPIPNPQAMPSPGPNMMMPQPMDMIENSPAEKYRPKENISHPPQAVSSAQGSASVHEDFENVGSPSWPGTPKSSQYEGVNKLYDMGDEPDRRPFLDALFALMEEKGTPLTAMPTITKQPLDLYKMYMSVKERGGCIEVSRGKRWRDICACLNINTSGSAGFAVRKNYIKFVLPYECRYDRGNCDPTPIIAQVEQLSQKKDKRKENAANKAAASAIQNSMPNSMDPFRHPSVPNNQGFDGFMPGGQRPPPIPNTDMPGPPNTSIPPGTNMMVNQMNTDGIPPQGPNGNMMGNSGMMPNHMNSNMPNSQLIPPSIPPGGHDSISVQDPFADQPPSGNQYPRQSMNSQMPPFSSMPQQSMPNSYYNSRPQMTSNIPYSSSQSGSFSGPPGAGMPRMPSQPSEQMGGPFPPRGMTPQEGFPNRGSMPSSSMPPEGSMANSQFPPNQSSISHSNQNSQLQFPYGPQYNRERFGPPQQPQQQSSQPAPAPQAAGPPGNNSSMPGMHGPPNSMGPSPGPMGSEQMYPGRYAGSGQMPHPPASGQQDQFSPSQGQSFQGQRSFQGQEPPFSSYQGQQPVMSQSPFMGQKSQSMVRDMGLSTPPKSYPPNMERSNTFPMNNMRRDSQQWTPSRPGWPPGGANSPYMQRPRASPHRFVPQKIQKQGSVTNQYPPRKEIVFPPDSVESTQPLLVKRRKARSKDVAPVDPWKLMLALKSGLIAQSSWALDTLSILLYDDSTVAYFSLNHLPGLIEVLLDHFRHCLREIFQLCSDIELGKSAAKASEEEDIKDSPKQCLMNGAGDFTWLTRQGKAVKLEDDSKDESFVLDDKKWDVYDKFCSSREDWDIGYGDISDNIILNLEHSGQRDFFRQCFFGKKHTEVSEESETREPDQDTSSENHEECKSSAGDDVLSKCENQSMCSPKSGVDTEAGCEIKGSCTDCNISVKKEQEDSDIKTDPAIKTEQSEDDQSCQKDTATEGEQANSPGNNIKQENTVNADGEVNIDIDQLLRKRLKRKLEVSQDLENEAYQHDNSPMSLISDSQEELSRRCICVSNIFRSLSFIPSNHWEMSQHHGLILVLGKLLTLHHNHPERKRIHRGFDREEIPDNGEDYVETGDKDWWWHTLDLLRENTLVILANITGQMALIAYPEEVCSPLLDGLLHWATCPAACAQDPLPTMSLNSVLSPQRLVLEAMCKLCVQENNVDLILAMPPFSRVVQLFGILVKNLADKKIQVLREFSIVLLSSLVQGDSSAARAIAMEHPSVSLLLDFIENAEHQAMQVAKAHGVNMLRENPEMMGTSLDMLRRAAVTLKFMAMVPSNRSFFMHHEQRLLDLVTSQILDQNVAAILAEVLFHCSSS